MLRIVFVTTFLLLLNQSLSADIMYSMKGTLVRTQGNNDYGLDGAELEAFYRVSTPLWGDFTGQPGVNVDLGSAFFRISNATVASSNGDHAASSGWRYLPLETGTFRTGGFFPRVNLPDGALLELRMRTTQPSGSSDAVIGGPVEIDDFAPADYAGSGAILFGSANYDFVDVTISASAIPEPSGIAFIGCVIPFGLLIRRRRCLNSRLGQTDDLYSCFSGR